MKTLRLLETCKEDLADEEAEGVDDEDMVVASNQACDMAVDESTGVGRHGLGDWAGTAQDPFGAKYGNCDPARARQSHCLARLAPYASYIVILRTE